MTLEHNKDAANAWGSAGADYDFISFGLNDGLSHAVQALWPQPGEHILDLATGTGRVARMVAEHGAKVTAGDYAPGLLQAARELSAHLSDQITFAIADAEALPFDDASFDGVISTYGVMFATDQARAARELARVTKPGGRLVLMTWLPTQDSYIPAFFALVGKYAGGPPPEPSPMNWGNPDWVQSTFAGSFDVVCEPVTTTLYAPDAEVLWEKYRKGFGPLGMVVDGLDAEQTAAFKADFLALHAPYDVGDGLKIDRDALMIRGRRLP